MQKFFFLKYNLESAETQLQKEKKQNWEIIIPSHFKPFYCD